MKFPDSTGLLITIVDGFIGDETMMIDSIDNYHYPFRDFAQKVLAGDESSADLAGWIKAPRIYLVVGIRKKFTAWSKPGEQRFRRHLANFSSINRF